MTDTPEHIKELQLQIWLRKTPGERLQQFMEDNDAMYRFWDQMKAAQLDKKSNDDSTLSGNNKLQETYR